MNKLDTSEVQLDRLITHHVGNKTNEEGVLLSSKDSEVSTQTQEYLLLHFLQPFRLEERFRFFGSQTESGNDLYDLVKRIFESRENLVEASQKMANLLYKYSTHPKIREGELNVAYFSQLLLEDEVLDAVGIFKSENSVPFLKMDTDDEQFKIEHDYGFDIKGVDKGCIVFNRDEKDGYHVLVFDNINKNNDAVYWKNDFLRLEPIPNNYHKTFEILNIAKNYLQEQVVEEFELQKTDQIDLLNRSVDYFKSHETFDKNQFESQVLRQPEMIQSFQSYDAQNRSEPVANFSISPEAVKRQAKGFKSVLKLDKNFHIYIHGDRKMIEKGVDSDGKKYYKIYFDNEE